MYYVLLIHADDEAVAAAGEGEIERLLQAVDEFDADLTQEGRNLGSIRLRLAPEARVLSVREGRRRVMDGPFVETKEQLGSLYIIEADSMEHALEGDGGAIAHGGVRLGRGAARAGGEPAGQGAGAMR